MDIDTKTVAVSVITTFITFTLLLALSYGAVTTFTDFGNDWYALDGNLEDGVTKFPKWENLQHFDELYNRVGEDAYYNATYQTCRDQSGMFLARTYHVENATVCEESVSPMR